MYPGSLGIRPRTVSFWLCSSPKNSHCELARVLPQKEKPLKNRLLGSPIWIPCLAYLLRILHSFWLLGFGRSSLWVFYWLGWEGSSISPSLYISPTMFLVLIVFELWDLNSWLLVELKCTYMFIIVLNLTVDEDEIILLKLIAFFASLHALLSFFHDWINESGELWTVCEVLGSIVPWENAEVFLKL